MKIIWLSLILVLLCPCWAQATELRCACGQGADDGDESLESGFVDTANVDYCIELIQKSVIKRWGGAMRFPAVTIPQGATINSAYIQLTNASGSPFIVACDTVACHNVDDATVLEGGTGTYDISERWANPTNKVFWQDSMNPSVVARDSTCDLKVALQDVVDREGWESGNAVMFLFKTIACPVCTAYYECFSFEINGSREESLLVDYTSNGDGATTKKLMWKK